MATLSNTWAPWRKKFAWCLAATFCEAKKPSKVKKPHGQMAHVGIRGREFGLALEGIKPHVGIRGTSGWSVPFRGSAMESSLLLYES